MKGSFGGLTWGVSHGGGGVLLAGLTWGVSHGGLSWGGGCPTWEIPHGGVSHGVSRGGLSLGGGGLTKGVVSHGSSWGSGCPPWGGYLRLYSTRLLTTACRNTRGHNPTFPPGTCFTLQNTFPVPVPVPTRGGGQKFRPGSMAGNSVAPSRPGEAKSPWGGVGGGGGGTSPPP